MFLEIRTTNDPASSHRWTTLVNTDYIITVSKHQMNNGITVICCVDDTIIYADEMYETLVEILQTNEKE